MNAAPVRPSRWQTGFFLLFLALGLLLAYGNSFSGIYVFDDTASISDNPTIRRLFTSFSPPTENGTTVGGRPLLNVSFALNFALNRWLFGSGLAVAGYHLVNLLIHAAAAFLLYGLLWRTVRRTSCAPLAVPAAAGTALLWALHPVQTESVTYLVQRAESLAGTLTLLSLYGFARSVEADERHPRRWQGLSLAAAALGMASKETVAVLPVLVWLYDRAFVSPDFRFLSPLRRRPGYYLALASTWSILLLCMSLNPGRGNTAGFEIAMPWWKYGLSQFHALAHYLRLVVWPHPLVFDYGTVFVPRPPVFLAVLPWAVLIAPLLFVALLAAWRRPRIGYAGVWFFVILAPTSTILPLYDPVWEHRLYLPLAAPLLLIVLGLFHWVGVRRQRPLLARALLVVLACLAAGTTFARNFTWQNEVAFWSDSVAKIPDNRRSQNNLGTALCHAGRLQEAEAHLRRACALSPDYAEAWNNLGTVFYLEGPAHRADAEAAIREALRLNPKYIDARNNLGSLLLSVDQIGPAWTEFTKATTLAPTHPLAYLNIGYLCLKIDRPSEALVSFATVLRLNPDHPRAHTGIGIALARLHRPEEAAWHLRRALALSPGDEEARNQLEQLHLVEKNL
ncbi:Tetratricopeptide repeat-containing protein [Verrucomicrobium sp. GAS474]|uniref:tetratricopeptide repeat protein n=1 Tax=Verrucomicrobium sp. GAS474 TaxID=1882831 RepID=UPI00087BF269|nr:tetratricopeptide repeat protein [Verrucomicrobium sp. GAS474]SDU07483.1 Tetratricopeptide repeat-containing protein [Verrucomicrobium sp. GAS474]